MFRFELLAEEEKARAAYEDALAVRLTPHPYDHYSYGIALVSWGDFELAVTHLEKAVALDPTDGQAHFVLGRACEANGQPERAWDVYQELLNAPADSYPPHVLQWAQERVDALRPILATPTPTVAPTLPPPTPTATPSAP